MADGAPTPGAAAPLAPFGCNGSPSSDASNRALHQVARGTLPSGAAEPQAPFGRSESPSISRVSFAYPASDGAPLPVQQTHGSLRSQCDASVCHFELRCALGGGRGSHSRCSRAAGSLRLYREPFFRRVKPRPTSNQKGDSPLRCSRAAAPFGRSESPSISRVSLLLQHRTGLPFRCSRPTAPFGRSVTPPSVIPSCAARSVANGAPTPGAAEPLAPFGRNGSPSSDAPNRALHQTEKGDSPLRCSRAAAPSGRSESPSISHVSLLFSIGRGSPSGAADPRLPSVADRVPHSTSAIVLLCQQQAGLASPTPQAATPVVHRSSSPVALPPFHLPTPIHISPQQAYFGEQSTLALWPLSLAPSFFWGVLWVRAMFRARSPPPGQQAKICLLPLSD